MSALSLVSQIWQPKSGKSCHPCDPPRLRACNRRRTAIDRGQGADSPWPMVALAEREHCQISAQHRPICRSPTWPRMRNALRGIGAAIMRMVDARGFVINRLQSCYSPTCRQKTRPTPSSSPHPATLAWSPLGQATGETSAAANRCSTAPAIGCAQAQTLPPPS